MTTGDLAPASPNSTASFVRKLSTPIVAFVWATSLLTFMWLIVFGPLATVVDLAITTVRMHVGSMNNALLHYTQIAGRPPRSDEVFSAIPAALRDDEKYRGVFNSRLDHWGQPYVFKTDIDGRALAIYSVGKNALDEKGGGDDVVPWSKHYPCEMYGVHCQANAVARVAGWCFIVSSVLLYGLTRRSRRFSEPA